MPLRLLLLVTALAPFALAQNNAAAPQAKKPAGAPADAPAERGVYFAKKKYEPEPLPTFAASRALLPEPVLPAHPEWEAMYWKCWQIAFSHLQSPQPGSHLGSNWLDEGFAPNLFQWDTCFMMMFARYGEAAFPAIRSLDNFYACQHASGYICREIREKDGVDIHFGFRGGYFDPEGRRNSVNPPLFAWAECESFKITGDKSRFASVLPALEKYVAWLNRDGDPAAKDWESNGRKSHGTPHELYWNTPLGSGMDNTPKPADKGSGWVDMSCQMVMQYRELALMCRELGDEAKARTFDAEGDAIAARINKWCWDETDGFYYDVLANGQRFKKKTSCGFWPLIAGIAPKERAARLIEHLANPREFNRPVLFPTLAADEKEYAADGGYWVGGVWAPTNYAILKGLEKYGYDEVAAGYTERYLASMAEVFKKTGTVWENYAPEKPAPGNPARGDFVGWTGIGPITLLLENVMGFRPDGVRNRVEWHLRLDGVHGVRRLRFGAVTADLLYDGKGTVSVHADKAFALAINGREFAVPAGDSTYTGITPKR